MNIRLLGMQLLEIYMRAKEEIRELKDNPNGLFIPGRSFRASPGPKLPPRHKVEKLAQAFYNRNYQTIEKGTKEFERLDFDRLFDVDGEEIDAVVVFNVSRIGEDSKDVFDREVVNELPSLNPMNSGKKGDYKVPTIQK